MEKYLLIGLGNPGERYAGTRHNVGFDAVDAVAESFRISGYTEKWESLIANASVPGAELLLLKPQTYMNCSGRAVARFADFYKIHPERIVVIHDDIDMKSGRLKLVKGGGAGGHNGIRSMVSSLGSSDFYRIKVGVGRPGANGTSAAMPVEKYVLALQSAGERLLLEERYQAILQGLELFFGRGASFAMNYLNGIR